MSDDFYGDVDVATCDQVLQPVDVEAMHAEALDRADREEAGETPLWMSVVMAVLVALIIAAVLFLLFLVYSHHHSIPGGVVPPYDGIPPDGGGGDMPPPNYMMDSQGNILVDSQGIPIEDFSLTAFVAENKAWLVGGAVVLLLFVVAIVVMVVVLVVRNQQQQQALIEAAAARRPRYKRVKVVVVEPAKPLLGTHSLSTPLAFTLLTMAMVAVLSAVFTAVRYVSDPTNPRRRIVFLLTVTLIRPAWLVATAFVETTCALFHKLRVHTRSATGTTRTALCIVHTVLSLLWFPVLLAYWLVVALLHFAKSTVFGVDARGEDRVRGVTGLMRVGWRGVWRMWSNKGSTEAVEDGQQAFKWLYQR